MTNSPFTKLFVQWSNDCSFTDYTESTDTDIGQVTTDDGTGLDDNLTAKDDILGATQDSLSADTVTAGLEGRGWGF